MIGTTLSHYKITAELGRGGMGIVYKARDTKLDRTVAIKVLPAAALASEDDRARFYREAKAAAALNHPHIAQIYQIDEAVPEGSTSEDVRPFIAMEFIEGGTLEDRIKEGPLKLKEAVRIATQVAEALKAAHAKEIVHRDIKSANIMLAKEGQAKVLDFGLAQTSNSTKLTRMGSTLGTVAYMSPEQARGEEVDGRTDLYSLGAVLYEMIAGKLPFGGEYEQAVVYSILNATPEPLTALRTGVPMELERITNKLLAKDAARRYQTAADLIADLGAVDLGGSAVSTMMSSTSHVAPAPVVAQQNSPWVMVAGFTLLAFVLGGALVWFARPGPPDPAVRFLDVVVDLRLAQDPTISPDGRSWVFEASDSLGTNGLYVYHVDDGSYAYMQGTALLAEPKFSPDGRRILAGDGASLNTILFPDGQPISLPVIGQSYDWLDNERIVVGGSTTEFIEYNLTSQEQLVHDIAAQDSSFLYVDHLRHVPGTDLVLLAAARRGGNFDLMAYDLSSSRLTLLTRGACCAKTIDETTLVYHLGERAGQVMVQKFDPSKPALVDQPVNITGRQMFYRFWGVGQNGTFLFNEESLFDEEDVVSIMDSDTYLMANSGIPKGTYDRISISPDGSRIAIEIGTMSGLGSDSHISIMDRNTGVMQRLTYANDVSRAPTWSSDGKIYYSVGPISESAIWAKNADGTGVEEMVVPEGDYPHASKDGQWLAYATVRDLRAMNLETGDVIVLDSTSTKQGDAKISPNGRFIAFTADNQNTAYVSGGQRMYVRSFPDPTQYFERVTEVYADDPEWAPDGSGLYFRNRGEIHFVPVSTSGTFTQTGQPRKVAQVRGVNVRLAADPTSGDILVVHPPGASSLDNTSRFQLIEGLPTFLERRLQQQ